jgi:hypothetical protein
VSAPLDHHARAADRVGLGRGQASEAPAVGRLKLLCVGTGRDGTVSVSQMVQGLYAAAGDGRQVMHEYKAREFYQSFCDFRETSDLRHLKDIWRMIAECPYDCIVGNGYGAILPMFAQECGRELKVLHIRRLDRSACVASYERVCRLFPTAFGYYSADPRASVKRIAAFHFGDSAREEWDAWPLARKFGWYYDKTHALIEACRDRFDTFEEIHTEDLDSEATRRRIAMLALGRDDLVPPLTRLNTICLDDAAVPARHIARAQFLLYLLSPHAVGADDVYLVEHAVQTYVNWIRLQTEGVFAGEPDLAMLQDEIDASIDRATAVLHTGLAQLADLCARRAR